MDCYHERLRDLPYHDNHHQHWDICPPLCTDLHSFPSLLKTTTGRLQGSHVSPDMLNRSSARYDPEIFSPVSPDRANRRGRELVNDMESLRDLINDRTRKNPHGYYPNPQDSRSMRGNSSRSEELRGPTAQSEGMRRTAQDERDPPPRRESKKPSEPLPSNLQAQPERAAQMNYPDELARRLRGMDLTIAQLQMRIDREAELWNLRPYQVPTYLHALQRLIDAYGEPGLKAKEEPVDVYSQASREGLAGRSQLRPGKEARSQSEGRHELEDLVWYKRLAELSDTSPGGHAAMERQPAALPPSPARLSIQRPYRVPHKGDMPAALALTADNKIETYENSINTLAKESSAKPDSGVSHTASDMRDDRHDDRHDDRQGSGRRKTFFGELGSKLAHSLSSLTKSLKGGQRSVDQVSLSATTDASSDPVLSRVEMDSSQSKREGKRPRREVDADLVELAAPQPQVDKELADCLVQAELLRRTASMLRGYAVARSQPETAHESNNIETFEGLRRVADSAAEVLRDHERSLLTECKCCGDQKNTILDFSPHPPTYSCEHPVGTCKECMQKWLASELKGKGCKSLHCPECMKQMDYEDVRRGASEKTKEEYDHLITLMALSDDSEFAWCLAPKCNFGQLNDSNGNYMECAGCKYQQCLLHKVPWHKGETCEVYEKRVKFADESEKATDAMIDGVSKVCPGEGCGWRIQKIDGCDHITCRKCKFQFCYQCRADHKEIKRVGNTAHAADCKFHSANLNVTWPFNVHS